MGFPRISIVKLISFYSSQVEETLITIRESRFVQNTPAVAHWSTLSLLMFMYIIFLGIQFFNKKCFSIFCYIDYYKVETVTSSHLLCLCCYISIQLSRGSNLPDVKVPAVTVAPLASTIMTGGGQMPSIT